MAERAGFSELFKGREVAVLCPTITRRELEMVFPASSILFDEWEPCRAYLEKRHPDSAKVAVFSASAQQMIIKSEDGS